jgi:hypothetical protein
MNQRWLSYHVFKGNCTYDTHKLQVQAQNDKNTPSSPRKRAKVAWSSGLVKISASLSWVETCASSMFPLLDMVSQEVVPHLYVFGFGVEH